MDGMHVKREDEKENAMLAKQSVGGIEHHVSSPI
jgi:hypothetical protein